MTTLGELKEWIDEKIRVFGDDHGIGIDDGGLALVLVNPESESCDPEYLEYFEIGGVQEDEDDEEGGEYNGFTMCECGRPAHMCAFAYGSDIHKDV